MSGPLTVDPGVTLTVDRRSASNLATSMTGDVRVDGNLVAAAGATLNVTPAGGRTLSGSGTVGGAVIVGNGAAAAPGGPAGPGSSATGVLAVAGAYSQTAGGRLRVQIASPDLVGAGKPYARQADALSVTGAAALDGTLELALLDGYVPSAGEAFRVVSAGSRAGRFARYLGLLLGPGADPDHVRYAAPAYDATGLTLTVADLLLGDATSDRRVDFADLVVLAQHYNRGVPAGDDPWADGDFNVDGAVDFADLVALAQHYNTGPGTAGPAAAAPPDGLFGLAWAQAQAPEPSVAVGALVLMLRSLRRRRPS